MSKDSRRDPRAKILSMTVRYKSATVAEFVENHSYDVSRGGLFIRTPSPFPNGTLIKFEVRIAEEQKVMTGVGRVTWRREKDKGEDNPAGMGVKFIKIDDESVEVIERLVARRSRPPGQFEVGAEEQGVAVSQPPPNLVPSREERTSSHPPPPSDMLNQSSEMLKSAVGSLKPSHVPDEDEADRVTLPTGSSELPKLDVRHAEHGEGAAPAGGADSKADGANDDELRIIDSTDHSSDAKAGDTQASDTSASDTQTSDADTAKEAAASSESPDDDAHAGDDAPPDESADAEEESDDEEEEEAAGPTSGDRSVDSGKRSVDSSRRKRKGKKKSEKKRKKKFRYSSIPAPKGSGRRSEPVAAKSGTSREDEQPPNSLVTTPPKRKGRSQEPDAPAGNKAVWLILLVVALGVGLYWLNRQDKTAAVKPEPTPVEATASPEPKADPPEGAPSAPPTTEGATNDSDVADGAETAGEEGTTDEGSSEEESGEDDVDEQPSAPAPKPRPVWRPKPAPQPRPAPAPNPAPTSAPKPAPPPPASTTPRAPGAQPAPAPSPRPPATQPTPPPAPVAPVKPTAPIQPAPSPAPTPKPAPLAPTAPPNGT